MLALLPAADRPPAPRRWSLGRRTREGNKRKQRLMANMQMQSQAYRHNRLGQAKTADYLLYVGETPKAKKPLQAQFKTRRVNKKGAVWKQWSLEAVCKAAFAEPTDTTRSTANKCDGSHAHVRSCLFVVASAIKSQEARELKRIIWQSKRRAQPITFLITNNMHDETKLFVRGFGKGRKRQRVLASFGQVTWKGHDGEVRDLDVFRTPAVLSSYTAATCATELASPDDVAGLMPRGDARANAKYYGTLMATDSHAVNELCSKWISATIRSLGLRNHFHIASFCTQHKTGAAIEAVTKYLGLLSPTFCIASLMAGGDYADDVEKRARAILEETMDVVDPEDIVLDEDGQRQLDFAKELLRQCYVEEPDGGPELDEESLSKRVEKRKVEAQEIIDFSSSLEWSADAPMPGRLLRRGATR